MALTDQLSPNQLFTLPVRLLVGKRYELWFSPDSEVRETFDNGLLLRAGIIFALVVFAGPVGQEKGGYSRSTCRRYKFHDAGHRLRGVFAIPELQLVVVEWALVIDLEVDVVDDRFVDIENDRHWQVLSTGLPGQGGPGFVGNEAGQRSRGGTVHLSRDCPVLGRVLHPEQRQVLFRIMRRNFGGAGRKQQPG